MVLRERLVDRRMHFSIPLVHFRAVAIACDRRQARVGRPAEVTAINHLEAVADQGGLQTGHAHGLWAHRRPTIAGANVRRSTDETGCTHGSWDHADNRATAAAGAASGTRPANRSLGSSRSGTRSIWAHWRC